MTGLVTPAAIAAQVRSSATLQAGADLIQQYTEQYARAEVQKALDEYAVRQLAMLNAPMTRHAS